MLVPPGGPSSHQPLSFLLASWSDMVLLLPCSSLLTPNTNVPPSSDTAREAFETHRHDTSGPLCHDPTPAIGLSQLGLSPLYPPVME